LGEGSGPYSMTTSLTAAIIGLGEEPGRLAPWSHAGAYLALPESFRIVGAADPDPGNAERFRQRCPEVPVFADAVTMFRSVQPDVVSICTPAGRHRADVEAALGVPTLKAVWCEKPLSTALADAEALVAAVAARGLPMLVTYNRRWQPLWRKVRELIAEGALGDLVCLRVVTPNRLFSIGSHALDLVRFLAGDPTSVVAHPLPRLRQTDEPAAAALFGFASGAYAIHQITGFREQLVIEAEAIGSKGRLTVREDAGKLTLECFARHPQYENYQQLMAAGEGRYPTAAQVSSFVEAAKELAALARDPSVPCTSDGASALATQRLIDQVASLCR
jgi:predicted dehydrogenase